MLRYWALTLDLLQVVFILFQNLFKPHQRRLAVGILLTKLVMDLE
ncbi:hypothetical protein PCY12_03205 [Streptococcus sp. SPS1]|nr:hypothetical protein [Streptococcus sp. SPS1]